MNKLTEVIVDFRTNTVFFTRRLTKEYTPTETSRVRLEKTLNNKTNKGSAEFAWVGMCLFFDV